MRSAGITPVAVNLRTACILMRPGFEVKPSMPEEFLKFLSGFFRRLDVPEFSIQKDIVDDLDAASRE